MLRTDLVTIFVLRAFISGGQAEQVRAELASLPGVRRVMTGSGSHEGNTLVIADVEPGAAEGVFTALDRQGVEPEDLSLAREERLTVGGVVPAGGPQMAWVQLIGEARANAQPLARYLLLMAASGLIAAFGVIDRNEILIVGAMAVSPDLLPLCAACVALQARRPVLARRALGTLVLGLGLASVVAGISAALLDAVGWLPSDFVLGEGGLGTLTTVDVSTVAVAAAAGAAGILAFETRASAAVGVAISVTTIPAASYLGVALGTESSDGAWGAAEVLVINVGVLLAAGTATLALQLWWRARTRVSKVGDL